MNSPYEQSVFIVPIVGKKRKWSKKHYTCKRLVQYLLLYWQKEEKMRIWLTLTSSPDSSKKALRKNWQNLRYRIEKHCGWERNSIQYRCVDTDEGHGVLHIVCALPCAPKTFWIDYGLLHKWWGELHQAIQLKVREIESGQDHAARLSTYIVSQYMGEQDLTVRSSGSRLPMNFTAISKQVRDIVFNHAGQYTAPESAYLRIKSTDEETSNELHRQFRAALWKRVRRAMTDLISKGSAIIYDETYLLLDEQITCL